MSARSYYEILEVETTATDSEIKRAYRRLAMMYHPDKNPEGAELFKDISHAYETLSDPQKRAAYDRYGSEKPQMADSYDDFYDPYDMPDMQDLHDMFGNFGGQGHNHRGRRPPQQEVITLDLTLDQLFKGKKKKVKLTRSVPCKACKGLGGKSEVRKTCVECSGRGNKIATRQVGPGLLSRILVKCDACGGSGKVILEKHRCRRCKGKCVTDESDTIEVVIKPGSSDGDEIRFPGKGDHEPGMPAHDLVFVIQQTEHSHISRYGPHLVSSWEIDLADALCGFSRDLFVNIDGCALRVTHSGCLSPDDVLRLPGQGMVSKDTGKRGDMFIKFTIRFPDKNKWRPDVDKLRALLPESKWKQFDSEDAKKLAEVSARTIARDGFDKLIRSEQEQARCNNNSNHYEDMGSHPQPECTTQ
ncbi:DnaJ-like protein xdj1 [Coemansia interrupta]|uniref:DnaJ-like protein xdj1 n=1 Tax=Coemansia interrupta TaxID=1126814 RepID=A0A9W8HPL5_9FUNG|nr:DnaJ-like protein xdj1 [Coemansia interrupta]